MEPRDGRQRVSLQLGLASVDGENRRSFDRQSPAASQRLAGRIINIYRDVRHIYTDGRALPPQEERWPTTWGDSVGRWEGDTLVVETVSVRDPPAYFFSSPPLSEQTRYVERIRKAGPDRIESVMTIHDPETLTEPWVLNLVYERRAWTG